MSRSCFSVIFSQNLLFSSSSATKLTPQFISPIVCLSSQLLAPLLISSRIFCYMQVARKSGGEPSATLDNKDSGPFQFPLDDQFLYHMQTSSLSVISNLKACSLLCCWISLRWGAIQFFIAYVCWIISTLWGRSYAASAAFFISSKVTAVFFFR